MTTGFAAACATAAFLVSADGYCCCAVIAQWAVVSCSQVGSRVLWGCCFCGGPLLGLLLPLPSSAAADLLLLLIVVGPGTILGS